MDLVVERMGCLEGRKVSWDCQDSGFGDWLAPSTKTEHMEARHIEVKVLLGTPGE